MRLRAVPSAKGLALRRLLVLLRELKLTPPGVCPDWAHLVLFLAIFRAIFLWRLEYKKRLNYGQNLDKARSAPIRYLEWVETGSPIGPFGVKIPCVWLVWLLQGYLFWPLRRARGSNIPIRYSGITFVGTRPTLVPE